MINGGNEFFGFRLACEGDVGTLLREPIISVLFGSTQKLAYPPPIIRSGHLIQLMIIRKILLVFPPASLVAPAAF
jgi:hypothetical protein